MGKGVPIVIAVKHESRESAPMFLVRKMFYRLVNRLSDDIETYENLLASDSTTAKLSTWSASLAIPTHTSVA